MERHTALNIKTRNLHGASKTITTRTLDFEMHGSKRSITGLFHKDRD